MGKMKANQGGFTLIELVVVIVILGILAATALPRFINMSTDARVAAINGVAGAIRSASALAQARYLATGDATAEVVAMQGAANVAVAAGTGIPTAAGIVAALLSTDGFTVATDGTEVTFTPTGAPDGCAATYEATTGVVTVAAAAAC